MYSKLVEFWPTGFWFDLNLIMPFTNGMEWRNLFYLQTWVQMTHNQYVQHYLDDLLLCIMVFIKEAVSKEKQSLHSCWCWSVLFREKNINSHNLQLTTEMAFDSCLLNILCSCFKQSTSTRGRRKKIRGLHWFPPRLLLFANSLFSFDETSMSTARPYLPKIRASKSADQRECRVFL